MEKVCRKCRQSLPLLAFNRVSANPDGLNSQCRDCSGNKAKKLLRKFGITLDEYERWLEKQEGVCAICKRPETTQIFNATISLSVDHNHETGRVRGLLCRDCNLALGHLNDNVEWAEALVRYLQEGKD